MARKLIKPGDIDAPDPDQFELEMQAASEAAVVAVDEQKAARIENYLASEEHIADASNTVDIVERAKQIANDVKFADIKKVRMGDMFIAVPEDTWTNRRIVLDYLFKGAESTPHFCEFAGRIKDHAGVIIDDFYDGTDFVEAFNAVGLRKLEAKKVIEAVRDYALRHRQNDLIVRLNKAIPAWDGKRRIRTALIRIFRPHVTRLNVDFGQHFWLSLFGRCTMPGLDTAGLVLTLIGGPGCGKSLLSSRLVQIICGDPDADSVQLDLGLGSDGFNTFLRAITGTSVVCNVGEMQGFGKADMNRVKDVISRRVDKFHHKFEGVVNQPRSWVTIMDSNRYEGLLKDDTGQRRFYPVFAGQLPDEDGKPSWDVNFKSIDHVNMSSAEFENDVWQLLAEARAWFEKHGLEGYRRLTGKVSKAVQAFSAGQREIGAGVYRDPIAVRYLPQAVAASPLKPRKSGKGKVLVDGRRVEMTFPACRVMYFSDFAKVLSNVAAGKVNLDRADDEFAAWGRKVGAVDARLTGNMRALVFGIGADDEGCVTLKNFIEGAAGSDEREMIMSSIFGDDWSTLRPSFDE